MVGKATEEIDYNMILDFCRGICGMKSGDKCRSDYCSLIDFWNYIVVRK